MERSSLGTRSQPSTQATQMQPPSNPSPAESPFLTPPAPKRSRPEPVQSMSSPDPVQSMSSADLVQPVSSPDPVQSAAVSNELQVYVDSKFEAADLHINDFCQTVDELASTDMPTDVEMMDAAASTVKRSHGYAFDCSSHGRAGGKLCKRFVVIPFNDAHYYLLCLSIKEIQRVFTSVRSTTAYYPTSLIRIGFRQPRFLSTR